MKKILLTICMLLLMAPSFAQTIGMVDYKQVLTNYSKAQKAVSEIDDKTSELQRYLLDKEKEFKKLETPLQKKAFEEKTAKIMQEKQDALIKLKNKKEQEIDNDIMKAIKEIALAEGLDNVVDFQVMYFGGVDITDKVIKKLNIKQ